jgi:hypothetical protein
MPHEPHRVNDDHKVKPRPAISPALASFACPQRCVPVCSADATKRKARNRFDGAAEHDLIETRIHGGLLNPTQGRAPGHYGVFQTDATG